MIYRKKQYLGTEEEKLSSDIIYTDNGTLTTDLSNLYAQIPTATVTGNPINITDSSNLPTKEKTLIGSTSQATNILTYKCSGSESGDYYFVYNEVNYQFTMPTVTADEILTFDTSTLKLYQGTTEITTTTASTGTLITLSSTPSPDYPQDIHVVTGDITAKVTSNLFNSALEQGTISSVDGQPSSSTTRLRTTSFINVEPNTTYYIRCSNISGFADRVYFYKEDGSYLSYDMTFNSWTDNFDTPNNCTKVKFIFKNTNNTTIIPSDIGAIVLYNTSQNVTLPLGTIELAKIGDYSDKLFHAVEGNSIYDSLDSTTKASLTRGAWYKQGNVGKVVLNGTTGDIITNYHIYGTKDNVIAVSIIISNIIGGNSSLDALSDKLNVYGNGAWVHFYSNAPNIQVGNICKNTTSNGIYVGIPLTYNTVELAKQYFATITPTIYYQLATPTYTQITDTSLITALNEWEQMTTYKNVTNAWLEATGTNESGTLKMVYRQDLETLFNNLNSAILSLGGNV